MRIWRIACGIVTLAFPLSCSSVSIADERPTPDARAEKLWEEIQARGSYPPDHEQWKPENGPWAPYLNRPFMEGLSPRERALYERALTHGDCITVESLLSSGFLLLYPFLEPVHAKKDVGSYFGTTVIRKLADTTYCYAHGRVLNILEFIERKNLNLLPFDAELTVKQRAFEKFQTGSETRATLETRANNELCSAMGSLVYVAFSKKNQNAIRDLLHYIDSPHLLVLSADQEYLLFELAKHFGIEAPILAKHRQTNGHKERPNIHAQVQRFINGRRTNPPGHIYWSCKSPGLKPFWKLPERNLWPKDDPASRLDWPRSIKIK